MPGILDAVHALRPVRSEVVPSMHYAVQGWDISARGTISKGHFVQGVQHPRTFGQGHIGQGHINPAYLTYPSIRSVCPKGSGHIGQKPVV
jgi:hypothetical protein